MKERAEMREGNPGGKFTELRLKEERKPKKGFESGKKNSRKGDSEGKGKSRGKGGEKDPGDRSFYRKKLGSSRGKRKLERG